jgi:hypothetical protein
MIVDIDFFSLQNYMIGFSGSDEDTIVWINDNFGSANLNLIEVLTNMIGSNDYTIMRDGIKYKSSKSLLYEYTDNIIEDQNLRLYITHTNEEIYSTDISELLSVKSAKIEDRINSEMDGVITVVMKDNDPSMRQYIFTSIEEVPEGHYVVIHSTELLPVEVHDLSTYETVLENTKEEIRNILRNVYKIEKKLSDESGFFEVWISLDPVQP